MSIRSKPLRFHLWLPDLQNLKGGIQVYSAYFLKAFQSLYPNSLIDVFLKHDTSAPPDFSQQSTLQFHCAGICPLPLRTPLFASQLIRYGLIQQPDLVIATHLNFTTAAYQLKRLRRVPYWTIAHGVDAWNITRPSLQTALHQADRILAVSGYTRDRLLREQFLDPAKVGILPNTFDAQRFQMASKPDHLLKRYHLNPNQPIILTVCRLAAIERYKGYDQILAALPEIRRVIPNVHYLIVGKGDDQARVEQLIAENQLQDCVTLAGFVSDEELCHYYNLCDVFAMPSKREGFGIVYLEAMACGKPVLGGNQDGAIDALCHGQLGALVNPDNIAEIAQTLIQILQGRYSHPLMYEPEKLRQATLERFGFASFTTQLFEQLGKYFAYPPEASFHSVHPPSSPGLDRN